MVFPIQTFHSVLARKLLYFDGQFLGFFSGDELAIPGYEGITLKADCKEQEIGFPNPAQNTCYFQISLILEDGTTLWQSELVKPGEISEPITLNEPLAAGVYPNSLLKFDCYTMDGSMRSLNGAATKMTIHVS